jgi:hypothetical protein
MARNPSPHDFSFTPSAVDDCKASIRLIYTVLKSYEAARQRFVLVRGHAIGLAA